MDNPFEVDFEYDRDTNTLKLKNKAGNLLQTFSLPRRSIQYRYNMKQGPTSGHIVSEVITFSDGTVIVHALEPSNPIDSDDMTLSHTIE